MHLFATDQIYFLSAARTARYIPSARVCARERFFPRLLTNKRGGGGRATLGGVSDERDKPKQREKPHAGNPSPTEHVPAHRARPPPPSAPHSQRGDSLSLLREARHPVTAEGKSQKAGKSHKQAEPRPSPKARRPRQGPRQTTATRTNIAQPDQAPRNPTAAVSPQKLYSLVPRRPTPFLRPPPRWECDDRSGIARPCGWSPTLIRTVIVCVRRNLQNST